MRSVRVETCVEALCQRGCREVGAIIVQLDAGEVVEGTDHLNSDERSAVLAELRAIMAVYDGPCTT